MEKEVQVGGPNGFVVRTVIVPPVTADCSAPFARADGEWVEGRFVKRKLLFPPIAVGCSQGAEPTQPPTEPQE